MLLFFPTRALFRKQKPKSFKMKGHVTHLLKIPYSFPVSLGVKAQIPTMTCRALMIWDPVTSALVPSNGSARRSPRSSHSDLPLFSNTSGKLVPHSLFADGYLCLEGCAPIYHTAHSLTSFKYLLKCPSPQRSPPQLLHFKSQTTCPVPAYVLHHLYPQQNASSVRPVILVCFL